jgi:hypothetical protein
MNTVKMLKEIINDALVESCNIAKEKFRHAILPVYSSDVQGRADHIGSSILIRIKGISFLVTAAHIIDHAKENNLHLGNGKKLVQLAGDCFITNPNKPIGERDSDHYDFAFAQISNEFGNSLGDVKYLTEEDLWLEIPHTEGHAYLAYGYPNSKNKKINHLHRHIESKMWPYIATAVSDVSIFTKKFGINDDDHICINFDHKRTRSLNGDIVTPPNPTGMSGGALIDIGNLAHIENLANPAGCKAQLIGLLIEHHPTHKMMTATRIKTIVEAINKAYGW